MDHERSLRQLARRGQKKTAAVNNLKGLFGSAQRGFESVGGGIERARARVLRTECG